MRSRKESSLGICRCDDGFAVSCVLGNAVFGFNRYKRVRGVVDTDPLGIDPLFFCCVRQGRSSDLIEIIIFCIQEDKMS